MSIANIINKHSLYPGMQMVNNTGLTIADSCVLDEHSYAVDQGETVRIVREDVDTGKRSEEIFSNEAIRALAVWQR